MALAEELPVYKDIEISVVVINIVV